MEPVNYQSLLLDMIDRPVFCVKDRKVIHVNTAARQMQLEPGMTIETILQKDLQAYLQMQTGCLHLTLEPAGIPCPGSVVRTEEWDVFTAEPEDIRLQAMALAAQQLRIPLSNVMTISEQMLPVLEAQESTQKQAGQINRGLFQLLRTVSNMADAQRYTTPDALHMELCDLKSLLSGSAQKACALLEGSGRRLHFTNLKTPLFSMACPEALERSFFNLLSNSVKFSPKGSSIQAQVSQEDSMVHLIVENQGEGISPQVLGTIWNRYQRRPAIEDGRCGIGLGMSMVRATASAHGGTVLIDTPPQGGTRITMTLEIRPAPANGAVRTPILRLIDYAGGWDHGLVELADTLSYESYCTPL